jgi:hypothetical protein
MTLMFKSHLQVHSLGHLKGQAPAPRDHFLKITLNKPWSASPCTVHKLASAGASLLWPSTTVEGLQSGPTSRGLRLSPNVHTFRARDIVDAAPLRILAWDEVVAIGAMVRVVAMMLVADPEIGVAVGVDAIRVWHRDPDIVVVKVIIPAFACGRGTVVGRSGGGPSRAEVDLLEGLYAWRLPVSEAG